MGKINPRPAQIVLFRKKNEIFLHSFSLFFLIDFLKYLDIVLSEIKDMPKTAFSAPYILTLKETTLSERVGGGYSFKIYFKKFLRG